MTVGERKPDVMEQKYRYGVIGTGWITEAYIQGAALTGQWELSAVCSRNAGRGRALADKYGARTVVTTPEELARTDVEAVYVASPNALHTAQSRLLLEQGKHVICEKPLSAEPEELDALNDLARKKRLVYLEAIMMLHLPARAVLHRSLSRIGRIHTARLDFSQLSSKYPLYLAGKNPNIFNPEFATGCLMDLGIYCVYAALDLFGLPDSLEASAGFLPPRGRPASSLPADGWGSALFRYPDKLVTLTYSKTGQSRRGSEIIGDEGTLVIDSISQLTGMRLITPDGMAEELVGEVSKAELMSGEARDFVRYIREPEHTRAAYDGDTRLASQVCRILRQMRQSAGIRFPADK